MSPSRALHLLTFAVIGVMAALAGSCSNVPVGTPGNGNVNGSVNGNDNGSTAPDGNETDAPAEPIDRPDPELTDPQPLSGKVVLPTGSTLSTNNLRVMTNAGKAALDANGAFQAQVISTGPTLAPLLDDSGNVLLLGFLDPGRSLTEISPKSTAVVLMFWELGGWSAPGGALPEIIELIADSNACANLAATLADVLAVEPTGLMTGDIDISVGIGAAIEEFNNDVAKTKAPKTVGMPYPARAPGASPGASPSTARPSKARISDEVRYSFNSNRRSRTIQDGGAGDAFVVLDPPGTQSGVTLTAGGAGFEYRNFFARRMLLYVLRTGEADEAGAFHDIVPPELIGAPIPVAGAGELIATATVAEIINPEGLFTETQPSVWQAAAGGPVELPTNPGSTQTTFAIIALGAAIDEAVPAAPLTDSRFVTFRDEWQARIAEMRTDAFVFGFLLPVVEQFSIGSRIAIPEPGRDATAERLRLLVDPVVEAAGASLKTGNGYFFAIGALMDRMKSDSAFRESLIDALLDALEEQTGKRLKRDAMVESLEYLSGANSLKFVIQDSTRRDDIGRLIADLQDSSEAAAWTAEVGAVRIRPTRPTVSPDSPSVVLRTEVAGGDALGSYCYAWTNTAETGTISTDLGEGGTTFVTGESTVQYLAPPPSIVEADLDTVSVRVFGRGSGACPDAPAAEDFIGSATVIVRGEEFDETPCVDFPQGEYVASDLLTLRIAPAVVEPGQQITATVTYNHSHPLAVKQLAGVTVWCSYSCGFCGPGTGCHCSFEEERRTLVDDGASHPADLISVPYVTALGKGSDRAGLRVPCTVQVEFNFNGGPDPESQAPDTHTFTFTIDDDWAPCPPDDPDCRCPELLDHDPDFVSERNIWSGPFVVARAPRLQSVDSQITVSETVARVFSFTTDPDVNTENPPQCP